MNESGSNENLHPEELLPWYVNGTLEGEEEARVREHVNSCLVCRREVDKLKALRAAVRSDRARPPEDGLERLLDEVDRRSIDRRPKQSRRSTRRAAPRAVILRWAAAASVVLALGLGIALRGPSHQGPDGPPTMRAGSSSEEIVRSVTDPQAAASKAECVLRWETDPQWRDAAATIWVTTTDLRPLVEEGVDGFEYRVAPETLGDLPAGTRLLWRVELLRADGERSRSKTFQLLLE